MFTYNYNINPLLKLTELNEASPLRAAQLMQRLTKANVTMHSKESGANVRYACNTEKKPFSHAIETELSLEVVKDIRSKIYTYNFVNLQHTTS